LFALLLFKVTKTVTSPPSTTESGFTRTADKFTAKLGRLKADKKINNPIFELLITHAVKVSFFKIVSRMSPE